MLPRWFRLRLHSPARQQKANLEKLVEKLLEDHEKHRREQTNEIINLNNSLIDKRLEIEKKGNEIVDLKEKIGLQDLKEQQNAKHMLDYFNEQRKLKEEILKLENEKVDLETNRKNLENERDNLQDRITSLTTEKSELENKVEQLEKDIKSQTRKKN